MTFDQSSSSNIGMLPGSVFQILRIKAKMRESRRGGGDDVQTRRGDKAKNRIITHFLCLIYSFPASLIVICMDPQNMMSYLSIMN